MNITNEELLTFCGPKLIEKFGKNTALSKFDLSPEAKFRAPKINGDRPVWSIVTLGSQACQYTVHGSGSTPVKALDAAGLLGWVEDAKEVKKNLLTACETK